MFSCLIIAILVSSIIVARLNMKKDAEELVEHLLALGDAGLCVQISGTDVESILQAVYQKGREDAARELREAQEAREAEKYISKSEAMALLGKSSATLWKWNKKGYLKWVKRGGTVTYKKRDVMEILQGI